MKTNDRELLLWQRAMLRANKISLRGLGRTSPNPIVGAVILDSAGEEVGSGFHGGVEHAEVLAINNARAHGFTDFSKATLIVTLEPCNHHGKTPPCSDAIIEAKFARVVFAVTDPNPVASGGTERLRAAGIEVVSDVESDYVAYSNRAWLKKVQTGLPWIITKIASTLDGKIAAADGTSQWITSEEARFDVAHLRSHSDAIVTTTETILQDNPDLTPRFPREGNSSNYKNPVRIVMGERAIPQDAQIRNNRAETRILSSRSFEELLNLAKSEGWNQLLFEAGARFNSALLNAGIVDEVILYQAPSLLGQGKSFAEELPITTLSEKVDMSFGEIRRIGKDLRVQLLRSGDPGAALFQKKYLQEGVR
jgi:diaminohydroxyphosphoribosylaminopyrimidine deaminase/5-amino-6-(5-phosphoribosylamino)uracil reductase